MAAELVERETIAVPLNRRYAGWENGVGAGILSGSETLDSLEARVLAGEIDPRPVSGRQELLENRVNRVIWSSR